jgi:pectin methylesterase-like acyl-CoA thioesterase
MRSPSKTLQFAALAAIATAGCDLQQPRSGLSKDATLKSLAISAGALNPAFDSSTFNYTVTAPHGTANVVVTPTATDPRVKSIELALGGKPLGTVASGSPSAPLRTPDARSWTRILVKVTAEDGVTFQTYTIALSQSEAVDASLTSLAVSTGTLSPPFASATTSYSLTVPSEASTVKLTPVAADPSGQSIVVYQDGETVGTVASGSATADLRVPSFGSASSVAITVTAQGGSAARTYSIDLKRTSASDASLALLTPSTGVLSPAFASATCSYELALPFGASAVILTPTASNELVRSIAVFQDGREMGTFASGTTSVALAVPAFGSSSNVTIRVTALDGATSLTYTIRLTQRDNTDAGLKSLAVSAGTLSPSFASGTLSYDLTVPYGTASVTVTPTANDPSVKSIAVALDGGTASPVASGSPSRALAVPAVGSWALVSVVVTAQDGIATATYSITLRQASNTDAALSGLTLSAGALDPAFASDVTTYGAAVPYATASVKVTPTARSPSVQSIALSQDGAKPVMVASGQASPSLPVPALGASSALAIVVTAADGVTRRTYAVILIRANANDASLSALVDSSGYFTGFAPATLAYSYTVPYQAGAYTVTPTANDPKAAITVNGAAAASGRATPVTLSVGLNTVAIHVTSPDGTATRDYLLTITELEQVPASGLVNARTVPVTPSALATVNSGVMMPNGATGANVPIDTLLRIGFDSEPALGTSGKIRIFKSDGTLVDVINLADGPAYGAMSLGLTPTAPYINSMVNLIGGTSSQTSQIRFAYYTPVAISGNTAIVFPHKNRVTYDGSKYAVAQTLEYGASYYVTIDNGVLKGNIGGVSFTGIADATTWTFSTKPTAPTGTLDASKKTTFAVNWNNGGDFATVQGGIDAVPKDNSSGAYIIAIAPGVYQELLFSRNKKYLTLKGTSGNNGVDTVIQYDNCEAFNGGVGEGTNFSSIGTTISPNSGGRAVYLISGGDQIALEGITLKNTHGGASAVLPTLPRATTVAAGLNTQSEALYFNSANTLAAKRSNFVSYQNTLQLKGFTWFYDCFVTADTDMVWGYPQLGLFERSEIKSRYRPSGGASIVQARAYAGYPGFVFLNAALTKEDGNFKVYLGRSNGSVASGAAYGYDNVAFVRSTFDSHIDRAGWNITNSAKSDVGSNTPPTPVQGWRQYGNVTPAGLAVDTSDFLATAGNVIGSLTLSDANARSFYKDRATLFTGATDGTNTSKGLGDASQSLSWSSYSGFFSP